MARVGLESTCHLPALTRPQRCMHTQSTHVLTHILRYTHTCALRFHPAESSTKAKFMQQAKWHDYCNLTHLALYLNARGVSEVTSWMKERIVNEYIEVVLFCYNALRHIRIWLVHYHPSHNKTYKLVDLIFIAWGRPDRIIWRKVPHFNEKLHQINNATAQWCIKNPLFCLLELQTVWPWHLTAVNKMPLQLCNSSHCRTVYSRNAASMKH